MHRTAAVLSARAIGWRLRQGRGYALALYNKDLRATPGEVEGQARPLDSGTDNDDVGRLGHCPMMRLPIVVYPPIAGSVTVSDQLARSVRMPS